MGKGGARPGTGRKKGEANEKFRKNKRVTKYSFTFKPFLIWLINKGIKKSTFASVNLGIDDSLFTHWLKSQDPPISTFLKIIEGSNGELRIEDFIIEKECNKKMCDEEIEEVGNEIMVEKSVNVSLYPAPPVLSATTGPLTQEDISLCSKYLKELYYDYNVKSVHMLFDILGGRLHLDYITFMLCYLGGVKYEELGYELTEETRDMLNGCGIVLK